MGGSRRDCVMRHYQRRFIQLQQTANQRQCIMNYGIKWYLSNYNTKKIIYVNNAERGRTGPDYCLSNRLDSSVSLELRGSWSLFISSSARL